MAVNIGASLLAASGITLGGSVVTAEEQPERGPSGTVQTTVNGDGILQTRAQARFEDLTFTFFTTPSTQVAEDYIASVQFKRSGFTGEGSFRELLGKQDIRLSAENVFEGGASLGVIAVVGDREPYLLLNSTLPVSQELALDFVIDNDGDARARALFLTEEFATSVNLGWQDNAPLASLSFNTEHVWATAEMGEDILPSAKLVFGNIERRRSAFVDDYRGAGRNALAPVPDITNAVPGNILGTDPGFLFGGRSSLTFLGKDPYDAVVYMDWKEDARLTAEVGVRLPSVNVLKDPFVTCGYFRQLSEDTNGMSVEAGANISKCLIRARIEIDDEGEKKLGIFGELKW